MSVQCWSNHHVLDLRLYMGSLIHKGNGKCKIKIIQTSFPIAIMMIGLVLIIATKICWRECTRKLLLCVFRLQQNCLSCCCCWCCWCQVAFARRGEQRVVMMRILLAMMMMMMMMMSQSQSWFFFAINIGSNTRGTGDKFCQKSYKKIGQI